MRRLAVVARWRLRRLAVRLLGTHVRRARSRARSLARPVLRRTRPARARLRRAVFQLGTASLAAVGLAGVAGVAGPMRPTIAGMASIPEREPALRQAVASIVNQVDRLYVYLNRYPRVPEFLASDRIVVFRSQDHGDLADNGKFFGLRHHRSGVFFSIDDDLIYPPDYVETMTLALRRIRCRGIVGVHGVFYPTSARSFVDRRIIKYSDRNSTLRPVSQLGTGTVAFSLATVTIDPDTFPTPGMADVWLATYAKDRRIPMLAVRRSKGWLVDADVPSDSPCLWQDSRRDHRMQSSVIAGSGPWGLPDLLDRVQQAALTRRLPRAWTRFVGFASTLTDQGAGAAVADSPGARFGDDVAFYCEPPEVLATAEAALVAEGPRSHLFRQTVRVCAGYHPAAAARLFERALAVELAQRDASGAAWLARQASRNYRSGGDLDSAQRVLSVVAARHRDNPDIRVELAGLALDRRRYQQARRLLTAGDLPHTPGHAFMVAAALAHADSVAAAAPWLAELFLDPGATRLQRKLTGVLRGLGPVEGISALPPFQRIERGCLEGRNHPLQLVHLYLALGDRAAAANLLRSCRERIAAARPGYLPWLDAAVATDFGAVVGHLNRGLSGSGFTALSVEQGGTAVSPLARLRGHGAGAAGSAPVCVIMTAFNCADTLPYALESILRQTVTVAEILVVDDASTDDTPKVISSYAATDDRVIPLWSASNSGPYACRNLALAKAAGEYIAIHDSDDVAHPQRLEHQLRLLTDLDAVACYASHVRVSDRGLVVPENHGEIIGEGPSTLVMRRGVRDELGYFLPVRSRGDIEHRGRMLRYYGAHRVVFDGSVLLFARDAPTTNSRRYERDAERFAHVLRLRANATWRHLSAGGRREALYVGPGGQSTTDSTGW